VGWIQLAHDTVELARFCEHGIELSGFIRARRFFFNKGGGGGNENFEDDHAGGGGGE